MKTFWLVWREHSRTVSYKHEKESSAIIEAERLAKENPGKAFHVMELKGTCKKHDVVWVFPGMTEDDIPF